MIHKSEMTKNEIKNLVKKIITRFTLLLVFIGVLTLLPAGRFDYWQVYVYIAFLVFPMIFILVYFLPWHVVLLADVISISGYIAVFFVFKQNSYASRIIEVDKGQTVISTGLYSIIRHPMYAGVIVMWVPIPVALGSYRGLVPMAAIPVALVLRILNEEAVLKRDLPGYKEYCQKTRYRLIPFIW